jgi:aryl-alcohol dehydrogenase-like predicted oxidoreductase
MDQRLLGTGGLSVSAIGLGCFPMTGGYGATDLAESRAAVGAALEHGITFFDTADAYGEGTNELFVGAALASHRNSVKIATKFGFVPGTAMGRVDASPRAARTRCEASLGRLGVEVIDLYLVHRPDPLVPLEETVGALGELVAEGKVRYIGVPEAPVDAIRRAHATHPLAAIELEYSLWTRDAEAELLPAATELGIGVIAYSPLGRGLLAGGLQPDTSFDADDVRRRLPRFLGDHLAQNVAVADRIGAMASALGASSAQLALAWLLAKHPNVVPIPGSRHPEHVVGNASAAALQLSHDAIVELERIATPGAFAGARYPADMQRLLEASSQDP